MDGLEAYPPTSSLEVLSGTALAAGVRTVNCDSQKGRWLARIFHPPIDFSYSAKALVPLGIVVSTLQRPKESKASQ